MLNVVLHVVELKILEQPFQRDTLVVAKIGFIHLSAFVGLLCIQLAVQSLALIVVQPFIHCMWRFGTVFPER